MAIVTPHCFGSWSRRSSRPSTSQGAFSRRPARLPADAAKILAKAEADAGERSRRSIAVAEEEGLARAYELVSATEQKVQPLIAAAEQESRQRVYAAEQRAQTITTDAKVEAEFKLRKLMADFAEQLRTTVNELAGKTLPRITTFDAG